MALLSVPITDLSLAPKANVEVFVYLSDVYGNHLTEFTDQGLAIGPYRSITNSSGVATFDLIPNSDINRPGTYYAVDVAGSVAPVVILKTSSAQSLEQAQAFSPKALEPGIAFENLTDVDLAGLVAGNTIRFQNGMWIPWPWPSGAGGGDKPWVTLSTNITLIAADSLNRFKADAAIAPFQITLPSATGLQGNDFTVKRVNSGPNVVTVTSVSGIDGNVNYTLDTQWEAVTFSADGSQWMVI